MDFFSRASSRWIFAIRCSGLHLLISIIIALFSAVWIFGTLYTDPFQNILKIKNIYALIFAVDVICGPLLTFILSNPKKSYRELLLDFSIILIIQIAALGYGLHAAWKGRPIALVFEADRFVVVTANQVSSNDLTQARMRLKIPDDTKPIQVGIRNAQTKEEHANLVDYAMRGVSTALLPNWWAPYESEFARKAAKPINELIARKPETTPILKNIAQKNHKELEKLYYLPLTSPVSMEWIAVLDESMSIVGYAPIDGF